MPSDHGLSAGDLVGLLGQVPFFAGVPRPALEALASHARVKAFRRNTLIVSEGDDTTSFFVVATGRVRVFIGDERGKEFTIGYQGTGSYFGELSLLDNEPRSASVEAVDATTCAVIARADFNAWFLAHLPDSALSVIGGLTRRIRSVTRHAGRLALSDVYSRIVLVLNEMAKDVNGRLVIENPPSRTELANIVGASREMVSKELSRLIKENFLTDDGTTLTINTRLPNVRPR